MKLKWFNIFMWLRRLREWGNQPYIPKPPVFRHILRRDLYGDDKLVLQEHITSVSIEGVIYYEDLRRVASGLLRIANQNRIGEGY